MSLYEIQKTQQLVDMYLPVTMSVTFANMVTGESLYSYAYTYYSVFGTTSNAKAEAKGKIAEFYRETYRDLMKKVISQAKQNFAPFSIAAMVKRVWNDNYILDKGTDSGLVKGDVLVDQHKNQVSVVYILPEILCSPEAARRSEERIGLHEVFEPGDRRVEKAQGHASGQQER